MPLPQSPSEVDLMAAGDAYFFDGEAGLLLIKFEHAPERPATIEVGGWVPLDNGQDDGIPGRAALGRSRPNPFLYGTTIPYTVARQCPVSLDVFSSRGKKVATLVDGNVAPGEHRATWNGEDMLGRRSAPGVYFCRLAASGRTQTEKVVLLR
jgi:hypothetical protein